MGTDECYQFKRLANTLVMEKEVSVDQRMQLPDNVKVRSADAKSQRKAWPWNNAKGLQELNAGLFKEKRNSELVSF